MANCLKNNMKSQLFRPLGPLALLCATLSTAGLAVAAPATADGSQPPAPPSSLARPAEKATTAQTRVEIDRMLRDARQLKAAGKVTEAQELMLDAALKLRQRGFERDQVTVLREMTLDSDPAFARAGSVGMAEYYYQKYLTSKPRDAEWLLEALAWAHYSGESSLLERFTARKPDKAHENIDARGKQRGEELKADDQQYLVAEMIRLNQVEPLRKTLKSWPYPINRIHTVDGTSLLHTAAWHQKTGIARMLVEEYKADVNVVDKQNDTPLDYAIYQESRDLIDYLKSKGGRANKLYDTPQGKAAAKSLRPIVAPQPTLEQLKQANPDALKLPANSTAKPAPATANSQPAGNGKPADKAAPTGNSTP
jgi:hypothetical protein